MIAIDLTFTNGDVGGHALRDWALEGAGALTGRRSVTLRVSASGDKAGEVRWLVGVEGVPPPTMRGRLMGGSSVSADGGLEPSDNAVT